MQPEDEGYKRFQAKILAVLVEIRLNRKPSFKVLAQEGNEIKRAYWHIVGALETQPMTFPELAEAGEFDPFFLQTALDNLASIGAVEDVPGQGVLVLWKRASKSKDRALDPEKVTVHEGSCYLT